MQRPKLIGVIGTHTEVGKTWVLARVIESLRSRGLRVAARKPVQSFDPHSGATDAQLLAGASGEASTAVTPEGRCYHLPMAPPMAADALGLPSIRLEDLVDEILWSHAIDVGCVETVGGPRSPIAHDGDSVDLIHRLQPDHVVLVADAGLGTINAVRLSLASLGPLHALVFLNRFDGVIELHRRNRSWLADRDGLNVFTDVHALASALLL
jgi:dethiobiotin synthetase